MIDPLLTFSVFMIALYYWASFLLIEYRSYGHAAYLKREQELREEFNKAVSKMANEASKQ